MDDNKFDGELTGQFFSSLLQARSISTFKRLDLRGSCDFSADETCSLLAQLIDSATELKGCIIYDQVGERKIEVELQLASSDESGAIKITNKDTKEEVLRMPTKRTKYVYISC